MVRHSSSSTRLAVAALVAAGALSGCRQRTALHEVARFEGFADPVSGKLELRVIPAEGEDAARFASVEIPSDTTPGRGVGTPDTVELATEWVSYTDLANVTVSNGAGARPCGKPGSFCALVTLRSYFATQELHDVYIDLTTLEPSGHAGFAKSVDPGGLGLNATHGLWSYPALLDSTRGAIGGEAPGANAASAVWSFDNLDNSTFHFVGRIMATPTPTTATGYEAMCGGVPTPLDRWWTGNCGECGRRAPTESACRYVGNGAASQGAARLAFDVCGNALKTACDSRAARVYDCVDLQADRANCGACGNDCGAGNACVAGGCVAAATPCGDAPAVNCPVGTTCDAGTKTCVLSTAVEVSVGSDFACATTSVPRLQTANGFVPVPTYETNVVCWGNTHVSRVGSPVWPRARAYLSFLEPNVPDDPVLWNDHLVSLWSDMYALSSGGSRSVALSNFSTSTHPRAAYFFGDDWNYVEGIQTIATKLSMGRAHGLAIYPNGGTPNDRVLAWGHENTHGQIGYPGSSWGYPNLALPALGHTDDYDPTFGPFLTASDVSAGGDTSCAVLQAEDASHGDGLGQTAGHVACWGANESGQASSVAGPDVLAPAEVADVAGVTAISVGVRHTVALAGTSLLFWGNDDFGQSGGATGALVKTLDLGAAPTSFSAGADVTCYVAAGIVYCAGRNDVGQLGRGTRDDVPHPDFAAVVGITDATSVHAGSSSAAGAGTVCATTSANLVYCWGDNGGGQLGIGDVGGFSRVPVAVTMAPL